MNQIYIQYLVFLRTKQTHNQSIKTVSHRNIHLVYNTSIVTVLSHGARIRTVWTTQNELSAVETPVRAFCSGSEKGTVDFVSAGELDFFSCWLVDRPVNSAENAIL